MWFTDWIFVLTTGISNDGGDCILPVCLLVFLFSCFASTLLQMLHQLISFLLPSLTGEQDAKVLEVLHLGHQLILLWPSWTSSWSQQNHITRSGEPPSAHSLCWEICGKRLSCFSPTTTTNRSDQAPTVVAWGWVVCNNVPNTPYSAN